MKVGRCTIVAAAVLCLLALAIAPRAHAQFVTKTDVAEVAGVIAGAGALIGVGVYFAVRASHTTKGCVIQASDGLELVTGDNQRFLLLGATSTVKPGELIKVHGAKKKRVAGVSDRRSLVIDKLEKDYGACAAAPSQP
jgi:hypothetical protein